MLIAKSESRWQCGQCMIEFDGMIRKRNHIQCADQWFRLLLPIVLSGKRLFIVAEESKTLPRLRE